MIFKDIILMVLGNLSRMRRRTILTASGVIVGTTALVLLVSLGVGLQKIATNSIADQFGSAAVITVTPFGEMIDPMGPGSSSPISKRKKKAELDDDAFRRLKKLDHVDAAAAAKTIPVSRLRYRRNEGPPFGIVGIDRTALKVLDLKIASGRMSLHGKNIILGAQIPKQFFNTVTSEPAGKLSLLDKKLDFNIAKNGYPDAMGPGAGINPGRGPKWRGRVVGILKAGGFESDFSVFVSARQAAKLAKHLPRATRRQYSWVKLKMDSTSHITSTQRQIEKMGFSTASLADILKGINTFFVIIQAVLGGVASIALLVAAFGIANTMTMAIYERTREIGIMKAVGAANANIMRIFLAEAATIGFIGGLGGVVFGFLSGKLINFGIHMYFAEQLKDVKGEFIATPVWLILFTLVFATGIGLISGIFPASRASKLSPLNALRHE